MLLFCSGSEGSTAKKCTNQQPSQGGGGSPTRLSWIKMVVGVPEAASYPGYSHHIIHLAFFGSLDSHFLLNLPHMWYYINNVDSSSLFLMLH